MKKEQYTIGVKYIGNRTSHVDNLYGTDLTWGPGETRFVAPAVAEKMLSHTDVYKEDGASTRLVDTASTPAEPEQEKPPAALPNLETMDRTALIVYAQQMFGEKIHHLMKEASIRQRIVGLINERGL